MTPFAYHRPASIAAAADLLVTPGAMPLGGGTGLLDLMKQGVEQPTSVVDLNFVPELAAVAVLPSGTLRVGAAATLSHVARRPEVVAGWPLLHETILDGLTPQLRNSASFGGNVMQRPRCIYFREPGFDCNKRAPGSGCAARVGVHFAHAIFGGEAARDCMAVHPSDLCVALLALDAAVQLVGPAGPRAMPIAALHRLPDADPSRETTLHPGEMVTAIDVPPQRGRGGAYVKGPEEGFALASCAALLGLEGGVIAAARIVLGGVAHRPWRAPAAEAALLGRLPGPATAREAAEAAILGAETDNQTGFRVPLLRAVVAEAVEQALAEARGILGRAA